MLENKLKSLDLDNHVGEVTLSNGQQLQLPKITLKKIFKIVKFIGVDGIRIYEDARQILLDASITPFERYAVILDSLKEEQLVRILSIILDISDNEALKFDLNETLSIINEYAAKTDLGKTFTQVRQLYKTLFKKELPDLKTLTQNMRQQ